MRIAMLAPEFIPPRGGVGIYTVALVKELSKIHDIHVITPRRSRQNKKEVLDYFGGRIKLHFVSVAKDTFFYNVKFQLAMIRAFPNFHKKYQFELVHCANIVQMPDIFLLLKGLYIPHVVTAHTTIRGQLAGLFESKRKFLDMSPAEKYSILFYPIIGLLERLYIWRAKNIIAISKSYMKIINKQYNLKRTFVIKNGIDLELFNGKTKNHPTPTVLFVGRLNAVKGLYVLSKAIRLVLKEIDRVQFVFCGEGKQTLMKSLKGIPKDKVKYMGFIDNKKLPSIYNKSDILVLPSFAENMPLCIMEAMSSGCPVIATDVGAIPELIDDGKDGFLMSPGDHNTLALKIIHLLKNKKILRKMQYVAREKALREFSSKTMAERTNEVYIKIVGELK